MHPLPPQAQVLALQTTRLVRQLSKLPSQSTSLQTLRKSLESISKTNVRRESPKWSLIWLATNRLRRVLRQNWATITQHMRHGNLLQMAWQVPARSNQTTTLPLVDQARPLCKSSHFRSSNLYQSNQLPRYNQDGKPCGRHREITGIVRWTTILAAAWLILNRLRKSLRRRSITISKKPMLVRITMVLLPITRLKKRRLHLKSAHFSKLRPVMLNKD